MPHQHLSEKDSELNTLLCSALDGHCQAFPSSSCAALPPYFPSGCLLSLGDNVVVEMELAINGNYYEI